MLNTLCVFHYIQVKVNHVKKCYTGPWNLKIVVLKYACNYRECQI
jgi:hypothetical protein